MNEKIKNLEDLKTIAADLKSKGKKVVHCHGVFDLLHIGHIKHFQEAKAFGDVLIVTITPDEYVNKVQTVTAEQVQQVAKQYLIKARLTQGVLHPLPITTDDAHRLARATPSSQGGIH